MISCLEHSIFIFLAQISSFKPLCLVIIIEKQKTLEDLRKKPDLTRTRNGPELESEHLESIESEIAKLEQESLKNLPR